MPSVISSPKDDISEQFFGNKRAVHVVMSKCKSVKAKASCTLCADLSLEHAEIGRRRQGQVPRHLRSNSWGSPQVAMLLMVFQLIFRLRGDTLMVFLTAWWLTKGSHYAPYKATQPCEDIYRAHAIHPITAMQLEWSLWTRNAEVCLSGLWYL